MFSHISVGLAVLGSTTSPFPHSGISRPFGKSEQRILTVLTFQEQLKEDEATDVILLTISVGGVGLTLTAASDVIHFDRCYNPAKEQQANDRAHSLGQR